MAVFEEHPFCIRRRLYLLESVRNPTKKTTRAILRKRLPRFVSLNRDVSVTQCARGDENYRSRGEFDDKA